MEDKYKLIQEEFISLPSDMGVIPSNPSFIFTEEKITKSLKENKDFSLVKITSLPIESEGNEVMKLKLEAEIIYNENSFTINLFVLDTKVLNLEQMALGNKISEEELKIAQQQPIYLETSMYLGTIPLEGFHLQLKIMNAIVPQASIVVDFMPYRMLSGKWLSMTAQSHIPPSPDYLYTIHAVYEGEGENTKYWLHTHGLNRCTSVELEVLNIGNGAQQLYDLIGITAKKFIEEEIPKENEEFLIGYDGMDINLCWKRWENALPEFNENILGGSADRQEGDVHTHPSGVLYAVESDLQTSPEIYAKTLAENPIYFISNSETFRMSELAKEHFHYFKEVFEKHNPTEKQSFFKKLFGNKKESEWSFLVKLGLITDDYDGVSENPNKEHLWFTVLKIDDSGIYGELVNEPYWIEQLKKGDKNTYPLEVLTDWIIYSPNESYTPDSIYQII